MRRGSGVREEFTWAVEKALALEKLDLEEAWCLLSARGDEIEILVRAADELRRELVGDYVTFVVNRNINFTNVCVTGCHFCAFGVPPGHRSAYTLTPQEIREKTREAVERGATEICLQGGINPHLTLKDYLRFLTCIKEVNDRIHIHAFSPHEVFCLAKRENLSVRKLLLELKEHGLDSMPGTAAEILVQRVRKQICPSKISVAQWVEVIETAHSLGIPTTCTMMYGTVESLKERAQHLLLLRDLQKKTGGFTELVLLPFVSENTRLGKGGVRGPSLLDSLRTHAAARLILGSAIKNLQASWVKLGPKGVALMLQAGVNDLGGTLMEENITRSAGGKWGQEMTPEQFKKLIQSVGRIPVQRTTLYEPVDSSPISP